MGIEVGLVLWDRLAAARKSDIPQGSIIKMNVLYRSDLENARPVV
jgi:hypothetical protein